MNRKIFIIGVLSLLLDQITKIIVGIFLAIDEIKVIIPNFFSLHFIKNYGAAWSILNNHLDFLIFVSLFALIIIYHYMYNFKQNKRNNLAFGLIIGGIVGNIIDRIFLGYVRDFLSFKFGTYYYPIFNIADTCIVIGTILLIIAVMRGEDKNDFKTCRK